MFQNADDSIEVLGLSTRVWKALYRSNIRTLGELVQRRDSGQLLSIRNLGEKSVREIEESLLTITIPSALHSKQDAVKNRRTDMQVLSEPDLAVISESEIIELLRMVIGNQVRFKLLNANAVIDTMTIGELLNQDCPQSPALLKLYVKILASPISVSHELETLLSGFSERQLDVLKRRHGFARQTLREIGKVLTVTGERVRQIERQILSRLATRLDHVPLLRIRSAVLLSDDMNLSFDEWSRQLLRSGLLGDWSNKEFTGLNQIEMMLAVCSTMDQSAQTIEYPRSLRYMLELLDEERSSVPAKVKSVEKNLSKKADALISRHLRYCGAVDLDWLLKQAVIHYNRDELKEVLKAKNFFELDEDWYMSFESTPRAVGKDDVLHKSLHKMFCFCGRLDIPDIGSGILHSISKTEFPLPPLSIVEEMLTKYGYSTDEEGLWWWDGNVYEELNAGEEIIFSTIKDHSGVAHHYELMHAIVQSGLAGTSLHATLRRSPLFDKFERGLYKLRGTQPTGNAVERARTAARRIPVKLKVDYDDHGNIIVGANLGILVLGNGTLVCDELPILDGEWSLHATVSGLARIQVVTNEIRGLTAILRELGCEVGDRIKLKFNLASRGVEVRRLDNSLFD